MSPTTGRDCEMYAAIRVGLDASMTCTVDQSGETATITLGRGIEVILDEPTLRRLCSLAADGLRQFGQTDPTD